MIRKKKRKTNFFQAQNLVFDLKTQNQKGDLNNFVKITFLYLCKCADEKAESFPSYTDIAKNCSISKRSAQDAIKDLFKVGLIEKVNRYKYSKTSNQVTNNSNLYTVNEYLIDGSYESAIFLIKNNLINDKTKDKLFKKYKLSEDIIKEDIEFDDIEQEIIEDQETQDIYKIAADKIEIGLQKKTNKKIFVNSSSLRSALPKMEESMLNDIDYHIENWEKYSNIDKTNIVGFMVLILQGRFVPVIEEKSNKQDSNNHRPVQETNFEQRDYDDDFYENLYDNF